MADDNNNPPQSTSPRARRSSFAGETFANLFGGHRASMSKPASSETNGQQQQSNAQFAANGPITQAAAQAQRRRLSISTLGLSGSSNTSPFGSYNTRRDSYGTTGSDSIDESAIEDDDRAPTAASPAPQTPFARRMSFGAKALRDVRTGGGGGGSPPGQNGTSKPSANTSSSSSESTASSRNGTISNRDGKARGSEGFNWSDNFRTRAERTSIASGGAGGFQGFGTAGASPPSAGRLDRSKSVAVMEPPAREMPKPKEQVRPDHFQERILKGDFYMD